jgi:hypothetical protein
MSDHSAGVIRAMLHELVNTLGIQVDLRRSHQIYPK